jgi:hypothetical protein
MGEMRLVVLLVDVLLSRALVPHVVRNYQDYFSPLDQSNFEARNALWVAFKALKPHWLTSPGEFAGCRACGHPAAPCSPAHCARGDGIVFTGSVNGKTATLTIQCMDALLRWGSSFFKWAAYTRTSRSEFAAKVG